MAEASDPKYDRKISGISTNRRVLLVRLPEKKLRSPPKTETPLAALPTSALSVIVDDAGSVRWFNSSLRVENLKIRNTKQLCHSPMDQNHPKSGKSSGGLRRHFVHAELQPSLRG